MRLLVVLLFVASVVRGFYLPGVAPTDYDKGQLIPLLVNHLTPLPHDPKNTEKTYVYLYDYYYPKFQFCVPEEGRQKQLESLGLVLFGDRIFNSPFKINMLEDVKCRKLCSTKYLAEDARFVLRNIRAGYRHNWLIDNLPVSPLEDLKNDQVLYANGFSIGNPNTDPASLFNHYDLVVQYHKRGDKYRVVGALVRPRSINNFGKQENDDTFCDDTELPLELSKKEETSIYYSYSVTFEELATPWATRWDNYLHVYSPKIQWFALVNFSLMVVILGIIIAHIFMRTLKADIDNYNDVNLDDDIADELGWKLVHGDVFRPPANRMLLSVLLGLGAQILIMITLTMVISLFGLLSPLNRGALLTFMFIVFILTAFISLYISGYLYRFWGGDNWKINTILTPTLVPGLVFAAIIGLNFFLVAAHSLGAIPFTTMLAIVVIWFVVLIPLSILGLIMQLKRPLLSTPVRTNQIPRQIPQQPWYLRFGPNILIGGLFPFALIFLELMFIYKLLWFNRIYYMFGFLFFCFILMITLTGLITMLMIYYTLCFEDYNWQWKSLIIGGSSAVYMLLHALGFMWTKNLSGLSFVLTLGYAVVLLALAFLCCGFVGFSCCLFFIRRMFSQIKVD